MNAFSAMFSQVAFNTPRNVSCKAEVISSVILTLLSSPTRLTKVFSSMWFSHPAAVSWPFCSCSGGLAGPAESLLVSGGADSRVVLWRDATAAKAAEAEAAEEQLVLQQQELSNALAVSDTAALMERAQAASALAASLLLRRHACAFAQARMSC